MNSTPATRNVFLRGQFEQLCVCFLDTPDLAAFFTELLEATQHARSATGDWSAVDKVLESGLRIIYAVNREARTMRVLAIGPRGDIY